jgi:hypothetical protein
MNNVEAPAATDETRTIINTMTRIFLVAATKCLMALQYF